MAGDAFYVGYLALPRAHRVFLSVALPAALLGMLIGSVGIASQQPEWGGGTWQTGDASEFKGTLALEPYPMLHVAGTEPGSVTTYLLVEMGKFGAGDRFAGLSDLDGTAVSIRGRELQRDGRTMIEIDPDSPSLGPTLAPLEWDAPAVRAAPVLGTGFETFSGEIMDSKCYLGAMKPGSGRGHKACATLCISGGIPPVLVVRSGDAAPVYLLLTDPGGRGLDESWLARLRPMIGEPVTLRGRSGRIGSWGVLRLDWAQFDE